MNEYGYYYDGYGQTIGGAMKGGRGGMRGGAVGGGGPGFAKRAPVKDVSYNTSSNDPVLVRFVNSHV